MIYLRTEHFDELARKAGYVNVTDAAASLGVNRAHLSRLRNHTTGAGQRFISAALVAFHPVSFEYLFCTTKPAPASRKAPTDA